MQATRGLSLAVLAVLGLLAAGYAWIAWLCSGHEPLYALSIVERTQLLGTADDGYRFYIARSAWQDVALYAWNYVLPAAVFLDGLVTTLTDGDLFLSRCAHIVPAMLTLVLVYRTGRELGIRSSFLLMTTAVVALMPLYLFVFLSFYGENWLTFFGAAALLAFVQRRLLLCACLAGLMPVLRAEGFFLVAPLFLYFLRERRFREFLLLALPGFLHLGAACLLLDNVDDYFTWRLRFREVLLPTTFSDDLVYQDNSLSTINPLWSLPALAALLLPAMRRLWPFSLGVLLWLAWLGATVRLNLSFYEPRYLLSVLPLLAVAWAAGLEYVAQKSVCIRCRRLTTGVAAALCLFVIAENMLQLDPYRAGHGGGRRWPVAGTPLAVDRFYYYPREEAAWRRDMASAIYAFAAMNPEIDALVIFDDNIFRVLDPARLPPRVQVSLAPMPDAVSLQMRHNQFYAMHPGGRQFAIYRFRMLDARPGSPTALYVGPLSCAACVPVFRSGPYALHAFSYDVGYSLTAP